MEHSHFGGSIEEPRSSQVLNRVVMIEVASPVVEQAAMREPVVAVSTHVLEVNMEGWPRINAIGTLTGEWV